MAMRWWDRTLELRARLGAGPGPHPVLLAADEDMALLLGPEGLREEPLPTARALRPTLAPLLDHTLLKAGARSAEIEALCGEARRHGFASVCVNPRWVPAAAVHLQGSGVRVCTVVGFPLGATSLAAKAFEAEVALREGATEVDMVLDLGAARDGDWARIRADFKGLRSAVPRPAVLKVILETCLLDDDQKRRACALAAEEGLDFVKTSTGFSTGGATVADVGLMRQTVGEAVGVKASGGIRTFEQALAMVQAGATRLGVSASLAIIGADRGPSEGY
ncbi:MAG TPA: deoxyribose-phosphate aldolase [Holophagaceae bacterium]|nr:deoxyribose-phosphate aldolase [Holophagaceae bacterium]